MHCDQDCAFLRCVVHHGSSLCNICVDLAFCCLEWSVTESLLGQLGPLEQIECMRTHGTPVLASASRSRAIRRIFGSSLFQPLGFRYKRERKALPAVCAHDRKIEGDARPWLVVAKAMNFSAIAPRLAHFVPLQMMEPRLFFLGVRGLRLH